MKTCLVCKETKEISQFYKDRSYPDGIGNRCNICMKAKTQKYYVKNTEKVCQKRRERYAETGQIERETAVVRSREWRKNNPGHRNALKAKYRADIIRATPLWAKDQKDMIKAKYQLASMLTRETGVMHHVHHEIPLRAELACGLHVFENLRVITAKENLELSNKFEVI